MQTKPLFYIEQPNIQQPHARMQMDFISVRPKRIEGVKRGIKDKKILYTPEHRSTDAYFKDLTIGGKVDYLINLPQQMPAITCEFITAKERYRGIALEEASGTLLLEIAGMGTEAINLTEIEHIRMLGF